MILFLPVFAGSYLIGFIIQKKPFPREKFFYVLLILIPLIFAAKVALRSSDVFTASEYLLVVLQWPLKAIVVIIPVYLLGVIGGYPRPLFGTSLQSANLKPYFILLALMAPLLLLAGRGHDFQQVYPKLYMVTLPGKQWLAGLVFELCYGIDFFTIELFFRGFIVLAFIKYAGKDAILPMAVFYCTIHFGKPLAECISSYFGGLILGAIVYNTRSIWGGLLVHLGIAWMMEIIGVIY